MEYNGHTGTHVLAETLRFLTQEYELCDVIVILYFFRWFRKRPGEVRYTRGGKNRVMSNRDIAKRYQNLWHCSC